MESNLIEKLPVHIHHFDSDDPTQLRLIKNSEIQSLEEQIKLLKKKKTKLKSEKLSQLSTKEKTYQQEIEDLKKTNSEVLQEEQEKLQTLKTFQQVQEKNQISDLKSLDDHHFKEFSSREDRFSRTLKEEYSRYYRLREDIDEMHLKFHNELTGVVLNHEDQMKKLSETYNKKFSEIQVEYKKLLEIMQKDSEVYEGHLSKLETEHDKEVHQVKEKKSVELKKEKEKTEEYNKLRIYQKDIKVKTKDEKELKQGEVSKLEENNTRLKSELESLRNKLSKTEEQIRERDDVIKRKENTIKELKAFNIHLINFHFVLNQKINTLKEERDPLDHKIKEKEASIRDMYNELLDEFSKKNSLKEKAGKLRDKNKAVDELNKSLRAQIFQNKRKMNLFQSELAQMIRNTEKDRLVPALKELYDKQIKRANIDEVDLQVFDKNSDVKETITEASFQRSQKEILKYHVSVKERLNSIQKQNKQYQKEKTQAIHKKQHENAFLIATCNELRNERQKLLQVIKRLDDEKNNLNLKLSQMGGKNMSKLMQSSSVPNLTELPSINFAVRHQGNAGKRTPTGKLQSLANQLDKNRDKIAQQTVELKRLGQRLGNILTENVEGL
jgi:chromosome segregation ATPase